MNLDRGGVFLDIGLENDDNVIARDEATEGGKYRGRGIIMLLEVKKIYCLKNSV